MPAKENCLNIFLKGKNKDKGYFKLKKKGIFFKGQISHSLSIKGHSFELISLEDNFLIKDIMLIILLFQLIKLNSNTTLLKDKYKKINIQLNMELN